MSALLNVDAVELNINAEYGYTTRQFSKIPNVYISDNYKSCLFLVYHQCKPIENRIKNYRNHFALFRGKKSIIIVRTETSLIHTDNDATLEYDVLTVGDECYRSKYKNWTVSFDKITYTSRQPDTFIGYSLIATGEWWFFDNGIILNGLTAYRHNEICQSIFIYYELHVDHKITMPSNQTLLSMPPLIEVVLKFGTKPQESTITNHRFTTVPAVINNSFILPYNNTLNSGLNNNTNDFTSSSSPSASSLPTVSTFQTNPNENNNTTSGNIINLQNNPNSIQALISSSQQHQQQPLSSVQTTSPIFNLASVPSQLLPNINAASRPIIRQNDIQSAQFTNDIINKSVLPSLYWLNERANELCMGSIEYFRPKDFPCPQQTYKSSILLGSGHNVGNGAIAGNTLTPHLPPWLQ